MRPLDSVPGKSVEGLTLSFVASALNVARRRALEDPGPRAEKAWRQWYNVYVQMLLDGIDVCPAAFQWEPLSCTC